MGPVKKIKQLVIDSGGFLKNVDIWEYGEEFFSVNSVLSEIRDQKTKERLKGLPVQINWREPSPEALRFMNEFTKKIGESTLSLTDLKVLALTYDLEVEAKGGSDHLRKEPVQRKPVSCNSGPIVPNQIEGFYAPASQKSSNNQGNDQKEAESKTSTFEISDLNDTTNTTSASNVPSVSEAAESFESLDINKNNNEEDTETTENNEKDTKTKEKYENDDDFDDYHYGDDDDDKGWITPSNIKTLKGRNNSVCEDDYKDVEVACMTSDFAIQNTLVHIGLKTIGVDGKLIKSLRMYTLRCFVCHTLCSDTERLFCRKCGYKTLKKVSYTLNPDGTKFIWLSKRPINTRGMKYSLPAPQGGKHAVNPILSEDQRVPQNRPSKRFLQRNDPLHEDYKVKSDTTPFLVRDTKGTYSSQLANKYDFSHELSKVHGSFYWNRKNINEVRKNVRGRKKK